MDQRFGLGSLWSLIQLDQRLALASLWSLIFDPAGSKISLGQSLIFDLWSRWIKESLIFDPAGSKISLGQSLIFDLWSSWIEDLPWQGSWRAKTYNYKESRFACLTVIKWASQLNNWAVTCSVILESYYLNEYGRVRQLFYLDTSSKGVCAGRGAPTLFFERGVY